MISVIIPVYNEEKAIAKTLADVDRALKRFMEYEIIVVNDGSTDATLEKIRGAEPENLKVINSLENQGYGGSLFKGILAAKYDCIAIIDGDGSYPADKIIELYRHYPQYDMVVGARSGMEYRKGILKRPARLLFNYLVKYASGRKVPDVNSGFRMFKKDIVMKYHDSLCTGFSFTTTLTLIFLLNHYYVKYEPIEYFKREGKSKVRHFRDTLRAGQIIIEAILYYNPIKLFILFAGINSASGAAVGVLNHFFFKLDFLSIFAGICVASFIPIFSLGLLADQLKKIYRVNNNSNSHAGHILINSGQTNSDNLMNNRVANR